jgi:alginate O-acetyltransferase complex protein AlgI
MGLLTERFRDRRFVPVFLVADLIVNLGVFLLFGHNEIFSADSRFALSDRIIPIGAAFFTVRGFSYVYDVFKGKIKAEKNIFCLMTYAVSFHLMIAAPVVRYGDIEPKIRKRDATVTMINSGVTRFVIGLGKAVLLTPVFEKIRAAGLNGNEITTLGCWLGMAAYFASYYFTFTGFADMGRGMGLISGFDYPENYSVMNVDELFSGMLKSFNTTLVEFFEEVFCVDKKHGGLFTAVAAAVCGGVIALWYEPKLNFLIVGVAAGLIAAAEALFYGRYLDRVPAYVKYAYLVAVSMLLFGGLYFSSFAGYRKWATALFGVGTEYTLSLSVKNAVTKNITLIVIAMFAVFPFMKNGLKLLGERFVGGSQVRYGLVRGLKTLGVVLTLLMSIFTISVQYI